MDIPLELINTPEARQKLILDLAHRSGGVSVDEAFAAGQAAGDTVTPEAYHNIARRLTHKGILYIDKSTSPRRYLATKAEGLWIDESHIESIVNPDYPLIALAMLHESHRYASMISEDEFASARGFLSKIPARRAAFEAICAYANDMHDYCEAVLLAEQTPPTGENPNNLRRKVDDLFHLLREITKYGLGLSRQAVSIPPSAQQCIAAVKKGQRSFIDEEALSRELAARIADEPLIINQCQPENPTRSQIVVAVDGSSRGGKLYDPNAATDFSLTGGPMVNVNTSVGYTSAFTLKKGGAEQMVFLRLPEKPEDMQRADNRFSVMAKMFYPDLTDSSYLHSVWNAMDLLENRAAMKVLAPWIVPGTNKQVPAADVVLRDGTIIPQSRESAHYAQNGTYGDIVRQLIEANWDIARRVADGNEQSIVGVVKEAQVRVLGPILNYSLTQAVANGGVHGLLTWPLDHMNRLPDQILVTRLLTAGRKPKDPWARTCLYLRPFFAATDLAERYDGMSPPSEVFAKREQAEKRKSEEGFDDDVPNFWRSFRRGLDPYVKMLDGVQYANFFVAFTGRLDTTQRLPRIELLIPGQVHRDLLDFPSDIVKTHLLRCLAVLSQEGVSVSKDHDMYDNEGKLDIMPTSLIQAHEIVKVWGEDLINRAKEYLGATLARVGYRLRGNNVEVHRLKRSEIESLGQQLSQERERIARNEDGSY